jgi:hypothetical protein
VSGGTYSFRDYVGASPTQVALEFKVGGTINPRLLLGFDVTAVRSQADSGGSTFGAQVTNYLAMATWFPNERGFFLRGGLGLAAFTYDTSGAVGSHSDSTQGVGLLLGAGYALWLGRSFNLTLNLDWSFQSYRSSKDPQLLPDSSSFWAAYVGFDWY